MWLPKYSKGQEIAKKARSAEKLEGNFAQKQCGNLF